MASTRNNAQTTDYKHNIIILAVMVFGGFITMLNQTLLTPALPSIMKECQVSTNVAQLLTTVFLLVAAIMIPLTAYFINKFPTRRLFMGAMLLFCTGSLCCAASRSFTVIMLGRVFQAAGAGMMMPLSQTSVLLLVPVNKRGMAMGIIGLVMALAPAIGPTLSGWVIDVWNWHIMFYIIVVLSLLDVILAFFVLENVIENSNPRLDVPSVILSSVGLAAFLYGCSIAGDSGLTTPLPWLMIIIGFIICYLFVKRQFNLAEPFLDLRILKNRNFAIATIIVMILNAALISGTVLMPIFLQNLQGFTAMQSGLMMLPGALCTAVLNVLSGYIFDRQGPRKLAICGISLLTISAICFVMLDLGTPFAVVCAIYTVRMIGISLALMPVTTWGLNSLPNNVLPHGTAINNTLRQVAGSIGTTLYVALLTSFASFRANQGYLESNLYGMHVSFAAIAISCTAALVLTCIFVRQPQSHGVLKMQKR